MWVHLYSEILNTNGTCNRCDRESAPRFRWIAPDSALALNLCHVCHLAQIKRLTYLFTDQA